MILLCIIRIFAAWFKLSPIGNFTSCKQRIFRTYRFRGLQITVSRKSSFQFLAGVPFFLIHIPFSLSICGSKRLAEGNIFNCVTCVDIPHNLMCVHVLYSFHLLFMLVCQFDSSYAKRLAYRYRKFLIKDT